jgi:hypothetical protein
VRPSVRGPSRCALTLCRNDDHTCALVTGGRVACWGNRQAGEPRLVRGVCGVTAVATAAAHTCVLRSSRTVACWGSNVFGELGAGDALPHGVVEVQGISDAVEIGTGTLFSCARHASGSVSCWGGNSEQQLGQADYRGDVRATPGPVDGHVTIGSINAPFKFTFRIFGDLRNSVGGEDHEDPPARRRLSALVLRAGFHSSQVTK